MLQNVHHRVPVTALAFHDTTLLSGEGNVLRAYHATDGSLLKSHQLFEDQQIHGLLVQENGSPSLLAWGGDLIKRFDIGSGDGQILTLNPGKYLRASDWILNAAVSPSELEDGSDRLVAFVTAHNALIVRKASELAVSTSGDDNGAPKLVEPLVPGSNCILYSAHVSWLSPTHCLVAAGTAFGDVILWSCHISFGKDGKPTTTSTVHYNFSAHEGSIFGLRVCNSSSSSNDGPSRMLATCSDDRTIRIWDISDLSNTCSSMEERQRDTGFGSREELEEQSDSAPPCMAKAMGHTSRIWHVRLMDGLDQSTSPQDGINIASFGEDTAYIVWSLKRRTTSDEGLPYTLQQLSSEIAHSGKHIWSVAISPKDGIIATGGADGAIVIHERPAEDQWSKTQEIPRSLLPDTANGSPGTKIAQDNYRTYTFLDPNTLLCTTDAGRVLTISLPEDNEHSAEPQITELCPPLSALRNYSVVASSSKLGFVAGTSGEVWMYDWLNKSPLQLITKTARKTAGLFAYTIEVMHGNDQVYLLVTTVGSKSAEVVTVLSDMTKSTPEEQHVVAKWSIELPDEDFVATSFAIINMNGLNWATIGSRNGSIAALPLAQEHTEVPKNLVLSGVHGKEAVSDLLVLSSEDESYWGKLHSVGRDGSHAVHGFRQSPSTPNLIATLIHNLPLPLGPNIEGLIDAPESGLWIWGFRGKNFVVLDLATQKEVMNVECGGAHRNWAFQPLTESSSTEGQGGKFIWTKASKLYSQTSRPGQGYRRINGGGHGREIKSAAVYENGNLQIFATGAEDTDIKLVVYENGHQTTETSAGKNKGFRSLQTLRKHDTGTQHLQFLTSPTKNDKTFFLLSSGGREEFNIWTLHPQISPTQTGVGVVCTSTHPQSGKSDLRITNFEGSMQGDDTIEVHMAYSDSTIRTWTYTLSTGEWNIIEESNYLSACLTSVSTFRSTSLKSNQPQTLLTAATDGHLALWPAPQDPKASTRNWTSRLKVHQNSILALTTYTFPSGLRLVVTGGDDNAIGLTLFAASTDERIKTYVIPRAHAAAVTGLVVSPLGENGARVISAGIDQRVKVWDVTCNGESLDVKKMKNYPTAVADVSDLVLCRLPKGEEKGVMVVGVGMDLWRIEW